MSARLILGVTALFIGWLPSISAQVPAPPLEPRPSYQYPKTKISGPPTFVGKDCHGDPMPAGARARLGSIRLRHSDRVGQVIFSPDGKWLASHCRWERSIKVWETASGKLRRRLKAVDLVKMTFAPDGHSLALILQPSAFTGEILVECWNLSTGKRIRRIRDEDRHADEGGLAFSPDGKDLYFGRSYLRRLDLKSGKILFPKEADPPVEDITALAIAANGATLITAHVDGSIRFRDPNSGKDRCRFEGVGASRLAISADGKVLALAAPGRLESWQMFPDAKQIASKRRLAMEEIGSIMCLGLSPDAAKLLSLSDDGLVCLWDTNGRKRLVRRQMQPFHAGAVAFDTDNCALAVTADDTSRCLRLLNVARGEDLFADRHVGKRVTCMTFSADGRILVTGSDDKTLRFWQAGSGKMLTKVRLPQVPSQVDFDGDGKHLIAGGNGHWWNIALTKQGKDGASLPAREPFGALPDEPHWHRVKPHRGRAIPWKINLFEHCTLTPDGFILDVQRRKIQVINRLQLSEIAINGSYYGAALAPNRRFLAALQDENTMTLTEIALEQRRGGLANQELDRWQIPKQELPGSQPWLIPCIGLLPGNRLVAVGTPSGSILFWDLASSQQIHRIPGHDTAVSLLAFSPNGRVMACAYRDATVLLWDCPILSTEPANPAPLSQLWNDLESADSPSAWKAHWGLVMGTTKTESFLEKHLRPVRIVDFRPLAKLMKELDSDQFAVRTRAMKDIEKMGLAAESALLEAQKKPGTLEKQRRLQQLLEKLEQARKRQVQELRALAVLEQLNSPGAIAILEELASGDPKAPLTIAARASRRRLGK